MESKIDYEINDSELVLFVREGNEDAKEVLYKKYLPLIYKEISRFKKRALVLGVDIMDLTQEAMLAFSYAVNSFSDEEEAKFITFATLCVRRKLSSYVAKFDTNKSKVMGRSVPLDAVLEDNVSTILEQLEDNHILDPLKKMINSETLDETLKIIDENLSENEKLALKYDLAGKTVNEIAELMDMNIKQIYNLIHRARNKIKVKC